MRPLSRLAPQNLSEGLKLLPKMYIILWNSKNLKLASLRSGLRPELRSARIKKNFQSNSNPYQMVHNPTTAVSVQGTSTSQRKRTRRKRSSKPLPNPALSSIKQPTMGLASLRQHQATLRRSEECLNSTLSSSDR